MSNMFTGLLLLAWAVVVLSSPSQTRQTPQSCTCVPIHLCAADGNVVTDGNNILNERFITPPPANKENPCNASEVCCNAPPGEGVTTSDVTGPPTSNASHGDGVTSPDVAEQPTRQAPTEEVPQDAQPCTCIPSYLCDDDNVRNPNRGLLLLDVRHRCNIFDVCCKAPTREDATKPPSTSTQVVETLDLKFEEISCPWQAAILQKAGNDSIFLCGGTLIGSRFVLTAAHCLMMQSVTIEHVRVRLGEYDSQSPMALFPHQDVDASEIIIHPDFERGPLYNDVAVIYLAEPAKFAPNINTVSLPKAGMEYPDGKMCTVTGWGKSSYDSRTSHFNIMDVVEVPLVDNAKCQGLLRKTRLGRFFVLHTSFLCAGGEKGIDACKGDGGRPLVCEENGAYSVAGIVAWGVGCGQENVPGVYVKVSQFTTWIERIMAAKTIS